jgi:hypothetical protein
MRADPKTFFFTFIMMQVMISPDWFHPFITGIPCMNGIMHTSIHQVAQNKTREERKNKFPQDSIHQQKN